MSKNPGKKFEEDWADSCEEQNVFYHRIKDVYIPPDLRNRIRVVPNKFDAFIYGQGILIPLELKSTASKSISFSENIVKQHQIDNLKEVSKHEGVEAGFLFNFRSYDNKTYFVPIEAYTTYKENALADNQAPYKNKINQKSIPLDICNEIGIEIRNELKKVRYRYFVDEFINKLKEKYE